MVGGGDGAGGDDGGDVGREDPHGAEEAGRETEGGADDGGGKCDDVLVGPAVEWGGEETEQWCC